MAESAAEGAKRRHDDAVDRRDACTFPAPDGTATFQATGDAARVFAAQQRVTDLARAARAAGDKRSLAQLRSDVAVDLLLKGTVPGDDLLGNAPAGRLHVIVNLSAILPEDLVCDATASADLTYPVGADDGGAAFGLGEVPGQGFLTPDQVRQVAVQAGSTWARLVTDPISGEVIDAASTYRVPAGMARLVKGRDHTCRAPGDCGVPAAESDLDHDTEHQPGATTPTEGATHPENLHALHRGHHIVKTGRFWSSRQQPDGSITRHTLTRRLRTLPHDHHRRDDQCPPMVSRVERQISMRLALCREHDLMPNVFTDLADLDPLDGLRGGRPPTEAGQSAPGPGTKSARGTGTKSARGHSAQRDFGIYWSQRDVLVELPEPPPPF